MCCLLYVGFTYFYKGKEYWKFNNQLLRVEPGYPRSILKDFMGCDLRPIDPGRPPADDGDTDVVIELENGADTVKAIVIIIPCVLALCGVMVVYTVVQFKKKGTPRHILYCKRSMQEWVWRIWTNKGVGGKGEAGEGKKKKNSLTFIEEDSRLWKCFSRNVCLLLLLGGLTPLLRPSETSGQTDCGPSCKGGPLT